MNIIAVDDEKLALGALQSAIGRALPEANIFAFKTGAATLEFAKDTDCAVAFLDIELRDMNGLELAKQLLKQQNEMNIVFVTGYTDYALDAMNLYASGYVLKPVMPEKVKEAMEHLRHPIAKAEPRSLIRMQCFGNFEVFACEKPLLFPRKRSKELLAFLVDRQGASSTMEEIASALWQDGQYNVSRKNQIHNYLSALVKTLEEVGGQGLMIRQYNSYAIDVRRVSCDFYEAIKGDKLAISSYHGEYMAQYDWAEVTVGELTQKFQSV